MIFWLIAWVFGALILGFSTLLLALCLRSWEKYQEWMKEILSTWLRVIYSKLGVQGIGSAFVRIIFNCFIYANTLFFNGSILYHFKLISTSFPSFLNSSTEFGSVISLFENLRILLEKAIHGFFYCSRGSYPLNWGLINIIIVHWSPVTHTFFFQTGELSISLDEFKPYLMVKGKNYIMLSLAQFLRTLFDLGFMPY